MTSIPASGVEQAKAIDWQRLRKVAILAAIALGSAVLVQLAFQLQFLGNTERFVADYRIATVLPYEPQNKDIVIAGITEDTLAKFPYRKPIDRHFLADVLRTLDARHVRGILVDVLFDTPTEPEKDDELKQVIRDIKVPLVISYGNKQETLNEDQVDYLDRFVPDNIRCWANLVEDPIDGVYRWTYEGRNLPDGGPHLDGVANCLVRKVGGKPVEGRTRIAWRRGPDDQTDAFKMYPAHTLKVLPPAWFKDKIVLVGAVLGFEDIHATPFVAWKGGVLGKKPGIWIHAQSVAQLLDGRQSPEVESWWAVFGIILTCAVIGLALGSLEVNFLIIGAGALVLSAGIVVLGFELVHMGGPLIPVVSPAVALIASLSLTNAYRGLQERQQKQFIQGAFSKYLSPTLLEEIVKDPSKLSLDARRREMSFIFTDVAGFTTISERIGAAELAELLNRYLDGVCRVVFKHGGTVDKFIGDAVFAIFNAPRDQEDHPQRAVACALDIDRFAQEFLLAEQARGGQFGLTRIGVHTGVANVGNFGSEQRFEYTALGDAVNTAARLEGLNKYFGTRVCVSGAMAERVPGQPLRPLGQIVLKGKTEAIPVFEPVTAEEMASERIRRYVAAYELMLAEDPEALAAFEALAVEFPDDGPTNLHLERLSEGEQGARVEMHDK